MYTFKRSVALVPLVVLLFASSVSAAPLPPAFYTNNLNQQLQQGQQKNASGQTRVLQGIPAIARAFAPIGGVKWEDFANVLAGICAVESQCNPTYPHYTASGAYSQYQGLFQMNMYEVAKAETAIQQMLPRMQAAAGSDPEQQKAFDFVKKAIDAARDSSGDRRFLPEYGIIIGAAKHIQINGQLAKQYPGDPLHQAAGHMTAQFSGITESKIRAGNFNAAVTGITGNAGTELGALSVNGVNGATTVAGAIEAAGARYGSKMRAMMQKMSQVTNGLTTIPDTVQPFNAPAFQQGTSPMLGQSHSGVSSLMEGGYMKPTPAPSYAPTRPPSTSNIPAPSSNLPQTTPKKESTQEGTGSGSSTSYNAALQSVAIIVAQPKEVRRGDPILVSWTSVGMDKNAPCKVSRDGVQLTQKNSGSQIIQTGDIASGAVVFTLSCTKQAGGELTQSSTVTVQ